jgi:anti-sigma regulatory factor (Ser/Thr protein kinase)
MWKGQISPQVGDIAATRGAVADHLTSVGVEDEIDVVTLLVSEVVSNAVLHGAGPRAIEVDVCAEKIHVEVSDQTPGDPVVRPVDVARVGGNGMRIVDALSSAWGVAHHPGDGKHVWFDVFRAPAPLGGATAGSAPEPT